MRPILGQPVFLLASALALFLASGCGEDVGGRCQINSDCASGLKCVNGSTGNGTCQPNDVSGSTSGDASPDAALANGPEVEPQVDAESAPDLSSAIDSTPVTVPDAATDSEPASMPDGPVSMDGAAADAGPASTPAVDAGVLDTI